MRERHETGDLNGVEYTLSMTSWAKQFPHMRGKREGRGRAWFLCVEGVGGFTLKRDALAEVGSEDTNGGFPGGPETD